MEWPDLRMTTKQWWPLSSSLKPPAKETGARDNLRGMLTELYLSEASESEILQNIVNEKHSTNQRLTQF